MATWIKPTEENLKLEYHVEVRLKGMNLGMTEDQFIEAAERAEVVTLDVATDNRIEYRSHTRSKSQLLNLIRGYRSYPEFRNEQTIENLYERIGAGETMTMPIVIKYPSGKMRVLAGNTRLDVAFQLGVNPKVLMIKTI